MEECRRKKKMKVNNSNYIFTRRTDPITQKKKQFKALNYKQRKTTMHTHTHKQEINLQIQKKNYTFKQTITRMGTHTHTHITISCHVQDAVLERNIASNLMNI